MTSFLKAFSFAAFCLFVLGCVLELVALLGFDSFALFGMAGSGGMLCFVIAFFVFALPMFVLQFVPPYREAVREASAFRVPWIAALSTACLVGWMAGLVWIETQWDGGGPEVRGGRYVMWLKGSNQFVPLSAAEYQHDMAIFARIMLAWVIAIFLIFWRFYKRTAELTGDR